MVRNELRHGAMTEKLDEKM
jgi:hypothetical protein